MKVLKQGLWARSVSRGLGGSLILAAVILALGCTHVKNARLAQDASKAPPESAR
jgi:hypothetical protein